MEQSVAAWGTCPLPAYFRQPPGPGKLACSAAVWSGSSDCCSGSLPSDSHSGWLCSTLASTPSFLSSWLLGLGSFVLPWPFEMETKVDISWCLHAKSLQLCPTLCDPVDYSLPSSSVHPWQEYWSGLPCSPLGYLPDPEIRLMTLMSPAFLGTTWAAQSTFISP